ncbi:MAG: divergent polysaccharide deacetylase family protein [Gammaproteobacteria bacterium]
MKKLPVPVISIIIDDLGYQLKQGTRAVNLPGKITFSFLPYSPYAKKLAEQAHQRQQEIFVHMPMQSDEAKKMGPGGLHQAMSEVELVKTVKDDLSAVPHAVGFNNHMGSLLTRMDTTMETVMKAAYRPGLYFIDSKTTHDSVALQHARRVGIYSAIRDVFLDHVKTRQFIENQLDTLVKQARTKGTAIAIGHPYKITLEILEQWIPHVEAQGVKLVSVSELIQLREQRRLAWQKSSSRSPRAVKN